MDDRGAKVMLLSPQVRSSRTYPRRPFSDPWRLSPAATVLSALEKHPMSGINTRRVILGGLVAGLVANAFDFVITNYLLAAEFNSMLARLSVDSAATRGWIGVFAAADFAWGFLLVFTYAAIRPRFGPGPRTAVLA